MSGKWFMSKPLVRRTEYPGTLKTQNRTTISAVGLQDRLTFHVLSILHVFSFAKNKEQHFPNRVDWAKIFGCSAPDREHRYWQSDLKALHCKVDHQGLGY
jgi:hypothetical protein